MAVQKTKADLVITDKIINNGKIYVLRDPGTNQIRYVGKYEGKYLSVRLSNHTLQARDLSKKNHRVDWIRSLIKKQQAPIIELIQDGYTSRKELCEAEIFLIKFYKDIGLDLVNHTDGGIGHTALFSKEHKNKISEGLKKAYAENRRSDTREKIGSANSIALLGNIPWNKGLKIGPFSEETRVKMSISRMGNKNARKVKQ
jgi:hypothetical protein